jgi:plasmid stability protein
MKTTLNLDDELLTQAKRRARDHGTTLTAIVEAGLRAVLVGEPRPPYRLDLPVVAGDAPPAVDPADRDALYAVLDAPAP